MLFGYATIQWWSVFFLKTNRHHCLESLLPSFTFLWSSQTGMSLSSCLDSWSSLSGRKLSVHTQTTWQTLFIFCLCAWTSFVCYFDTVVSSQSGMGLGWEFYHGHLHWNILPSGLDWPLFTLSLASHACHPRLGWLWGSGTCLPCLVIFCSCTIDAHYTCWLSRIVTFCSALFVLWLSFCHPRLGWLGCLCLTTRFIPVWDEHNTSGHLKSTKNSKKKCRLHFFHDFTFRFHLLQRLRQVQ